MHTSKYSVIIANCHQKTGFFKHLHSSEISEQCLIFFVLVWNLIISNNILIKNISTCLHNNWIWSVIFRKTHHTRHILKLFFIQMSVSPKVFVSEKRDCTFWKWRNGRTSALKWRKSRMHRMKMKDFKDQNVLIFLYQQYVLVFKSSDAYVT